MISLVNLNVTDGYDATREIRNHADPAIRNILVIAMTASAIQGDREKCLDAGMNNYLAKPVRVQMLKTLLETYLSQPPKPIENLQTKGADIVKHVLEDAQADSRGKENENLDGQGDMGPPAIPRRPPMKERSSASSDRTVVPDDHSPPNL